MRRLASHSCSVASLRPRHGGFGRRLVRGAIFALACLAGVGLSAGERSSARADDGGMMSFLLNGNGGGRARAAAPQFRFDPPAYRDRASVVRTAAHARKAVARASRHAPPRQRAARPNQMASAGAKDLVHKISYVASPQAADAKTTAQALALKAAAAAARPEDSHLKDKTLRRGDIVATTAGLRVFLGAEHFPYRARDFVPVAAARHVAQRPVLEALDRSLRGVRLVARSQLHKRVAKIEERPATPPAANAAIRRVDSRPAQAVVLAYAPAAGVVGAKADAPAMQALERVVRRIDLPPAPRAAAERTRLVADQPKSVAKKTE